MLLRTRLTLMVSISLLAVTGVLTLEGQIRQQALVDRYEEAELTVIRGTWAGTAADEARRLKAEIDTLEEAEVTSILAVSAMSEALAKGAMPRDAEIPVEIRSKLDAILARVRSRIPEADLEVVGKDGVTAYSSSGRQASFLADDNLLRVLSAGGFVSGVSRLSNDDIGIVLATPLEGRGGVVGAAALVERADNLLRVMHAMTSANLFLTTPAGRRIGAESDIAWPEGQINVANLPPGGQREIGWVGKQILDASVVPIFAGSGSGAQIATLVSLTDVTASWREDELVAWLCVGGVWVALALFLAALYWYLRDSFRPLNATIRVLAALARGDTTVVGPATAGNQEIDRLVRTMDGFRKAQKLLTETTAAKERIDSELAVARDIQKQIVPSHFGFPGNPEFELHAVMEPAKAVGGDLYDFFLIDERRLFFLIGDVSDKGTPAALYMAIAKALFRNSAQNRNLPLNEVMASVNRQLAIDTPTEMFVTIFACVLDLETGVITYSDGGHELPALLRADGSAELLAKRGGLALGFMPDYVFTTGEIRLSPGDALLVYTDGVTEAMNELHALFSAEGIVRVLTGVTVEAPTTTITRTLLAAVRSFAGTAPQSDDITMLAVRWKGPQSGFRMQPAEG